MCLFAPFAVRFLNQIFPVADSFSESDGAGAARTYKMSVRSGWQTILDQLGQCGCIIFSVDAVVPGSWPGVGAGRADGVVTDDVVGAARFGGLWSRGPRFRGEGNVVRSGSRRIFTAGVVGCVGTGTRAYRCLRGRSVQAVCAGAAHIEFYELR